MTNLEARAAAEKAANIAKHRALGKSHRIEIDLHRDSGAYVRTAVLYVALNGREPAAIAAHCALSNRCSVSRSEFRAEAL